MRSERRLARLPLLTRAGMPVAHVITSTEIRPAFGQVLQVWNLLDSGPNLPRSGLHLARTTPDLAAFSQERIVGIDVKGSVPASAAPMGRLKPRAGATRYQPGHRLGINRGHA